MLQRPGLGLEKETSQQQRQQQSCQRIPSLPSISLLPFLIFIACQIFHKVGAPVFFKSLIYWLCHTLNLQSSPNLSWWRPASSSPDRGPSNSLSRKPLPPPATITSIHLFLMCQDLRVECSHLSPPLFLFRVPCAASCKNAPSQAPIGKCRASYPYSTQEPGGLALAKGDVINILEKDANGWWLGECKGNKGVFPSNYVEELTLGKCGI